MSYKHCRNETWVSIQSCYSWWQPTATGRVIEAGISD